MDNNKTNHNQMCPAIFTGLTISSNKSIKPCCAYGDEHALRSYAIEKTIDNHNDFGIITDTYRLKDVLESKERKKLQQAARNNEISPGCQICEDRYLIDKIRSQKTTWLRPLGEGGYKGYHEGWENNITLLELENSNTCNLSCAPCNSFFSSSWLKYEEMIVDPIPWGSRHPKAVPTTSFDLVSQLKEIDLTKLKTLMLKGGEPFMNPELLPILQYLSDINVLSNMTIVITTNGTILGKEIDAIKVFLAEAWAIRFALSVDGVGDVGTYIRYSPQKFAKISNIESFIQKFEEYPNMKFTLFPSIQIYNIFSLDEIVNWWDITCQKYKNAKDYVELNHIVVAPNYLSVGALQPATMEKIIQYYRNKSDRRYRKLVSSLEKISYLGDEIHNQMIEYTLEMDRVKNQNVFECIPELADEMILI